MNSYSLNSKFFYLNNGFEYFFGIWNFENSIALNAQAIKETGATVVEGNNYFIASSTFFSGNGPQSLISIENDKNSDLDVLLFRGYILDAPIHSLSEKNKIRGYWKKEFDRQHNGVFATVGIKNNGKTLVMVTDAFGIGTLYYRRLGQSVVFASSPRFLACQGDQQDLISWRCMMENGFIPGNRSLSNNVERIAPGTVVTFEGLEMKQKSWFDFCRLPEGQSDITPYDIDIVEEAFSSAMSRCLKLDTEKRLLPLSGGYDSRHILGYMLKNKENFISTTVRTPDAQNRDVDAFFSEKMAKDFHFLNDIHEMPAADQLIKAEEIRRFCLDHESIRHAWYLPVWKDAGRSTLVLDGLCGDTLGHSGLKVSNLHSNYVPAHQWIAKNLLQPNFDSVLNDDVWPAHEQIVAEFLSAIDWLPPTNNLIDLVMILHRARRAVSISSQQFTKPGHISVYPYLDLDYVKTILKYSPIERFKKSFQKQCLKKHFFKIFSYPGSHNLPDNFNRTFRKKTVL